MSRYTCNYIAGRAEAIRTLLVEQGVEYEEQDVMPMEKWLNEWKPKMERRLYWHFLLFDSRSTLVDHFTCN